MAVCVCVDELGFVRVGFVMFTSEVDGGDSSVPFALEYVFGGDLCLVVSELT